MITNTKFAQKLLAAQDKRRNLTTTETMLETALLQAALLGGRIDDRDKLAVLEEHMSEHSDLFWDYLTFALVATGDSFGVRPGTWQTRTSDELSSILTPVTATPEDAARIRKVLAVVAEAIQEREGAMSEEMKAEPAGAFLLEIAFTISRLAASRASSAKTSAALFIRGVRRITDEYHAANKE